MKCKVLHNVCKQDNKSLENINKIIYEQTGILPVCFITGGN